MKILLPNIIELSWIQFIIVMLIFCTLSEFSYFRNEHHLINGSYGIALFILYNGILKTNKK
jgi:hypothetical protein